MDVRVRATAEALEVILRLRAAHGTAHLVRASGTLVADVCTRER
jgi:hypothetical protein